MPEKTTKMPLSSSFQCMGLPQSSVFPQQDKEGQLSFDDLKTNDDSKPMNSVITSLLTKIFLHKK